jgi:hypothetical protein
MNITEDLKQDVLALSDMLLADISGDPLRMQLLKVGWRWKSARHGSRGHLVQAHHGMRGGEAVNRPPKLAAAQSEWVSQCSNSWTCKVGECEIVATAWTSGDYVEMSIESCDNDIANGVGKSWEKAWRSLWGSAHVNLVLLADFVAVTRHCFEGFAQEVKS